MVIIYTFYWNYRAFFCRKTNIDHHENLKMYKDVDEEGKFDFTEDIRKFLDVASAIGSYGKGKYLCVLTGKIWGRVVAKFKEHPLFGCGRDKTVDWWRQIGVFLIDNQIVMSLGTIFGESLKYLTDMCFSTIFTLWK